MKRIVKVLANVMARTVVLPAAVCCRLGCHVWTNEKAFPGWSQLFSLIPGISGVYLRRAFYVQILPRCDGDAWISFGTVFSHPTAHLGRKVYVGTYCCFGDITLENDVLIGSHVSIMNGNAQHGISRLDVPVREQPGHWPHITIGEDTWIGDRAVIMADVGRHCVIGAGSVVTRPIPDFAIAVGCPAKVTGDRRDLHEANESNARQLSHGVPLSTSTIDN